MRGLNNTVSTEGYFFVVGIMLALLRSIVDGTRRTALSLVVACLFGGVGATVTGIALEGTRWQYPLMGIAAVISENIAIGLFRASTTFSQHPLTTFAQLWKITMPWFSLPWDKDPDID